MAIQPELTKAVIAAVHGQPPPRSALGHPARCLGHFGATAFRQGQMNSQVTSGSMRRSLDRRRLVITRPEGVEHLTLGFGEAQATANLHPLVGAIET